MAEVTIEVEGTITCSLEEARGGWVIVTNSDWQRVKNLLVKEQLLALDDIIIRPMVADNLDLLKEEN